MNPIPQNPPRFGIPEEEPSCCDRCLDGVYNVAKKVVLFVVNIFVQIFRCIFCCWCCPSEELPAGPPLPTPIQPPAQPPVAPAPVDPNFWNNRPVDRPPVQRPPVLPTPIYNTPRRPQPIFNPFNPRPPFWRPNPPAVIPTPAPVIPAPAPVAPPKPPAVVTPPVVLRPMPVFKMEFDIPLVPSDTAKAEGAGIEPCPALPVAPAVGYEADVDIFAPRLDKNLLLAQISHHLHQAHHWSQNFDDSVPDQMEDVPGVGQVNHAVRRTGESIAEFGPKGYVKAYQGPVNPVLEEYIRNNPDLLEMDDFITLIESYRRDRFQIDVPARAGVKEIGDRYEVDVALDRDPEVSFKRRVGRLALVWAAAKRHEYDATNELNHPFEKIFDSLSANRASLEKDGNPDSLEDHEIELGPDFPNSNKDTPYIQARRTLIGFQELSRIMPLIRVFADQKKQVTIENGTKPSPYNLFPIAGAKRFTSAAYQVGYMRDIVLLLTQAFSRIYVTNPRNNKIGLQGKDDKGKAFFEQFPMEELTADKIAVTMDMIWKGYHYALENNDLPAYFESISKGYCFDARTSFITEYYQKYAGANKDFILDTEKLKNPSEDIRICEYHRVFLNDQCAVYTSRNGTKFGTFKKKIGSSTEDAETEDFYKNYASRERFRAWVETKYQEPTHAGIPLIDITDDAHWKDLIDTQVEYCTMSFGETT